MEVARAGSMLHAAGAVDQAGAFWQQAAGKGLALLDFTSKCTTPCRQEGGQSRECERIKVVQGFKRSSSGHTNALPHLAVQVVEGSGQVKCRPLAPPVPAKHALP